MGPREAIDRKKLGTCWRYLGMALRLVRRVRSAPVTPGVRAAPSHFSECVTTSTAEGSGSARSGRKSGRRVGTQQTKRSGCMTRVAVRTTRATTTCGLRAR